jgi:hypothetical protein
MDKVLKPRELSYLVHARSDSRIKFLYRDYNIGDFNGAGSHYFTSNSFVQNVVRTESALRTKYVLSYCQIRNSEQGSRSLLFYSTGLQFYRVYNEKS